MRRRFSGGSTIFLLRNSEMCAGVLVPRPALAVAAARARAALGKTAMIVAEFAT